MSIIESIIEKMQNFNKENLIDLAISAIVIILCFMMSKFISYLIIIIGFSPCKSSMDTVAVMVRVSLGNNEMKLSLQNTGFTTSFVFSLCIFFISLITS